MPDRPQSDPPTDTLTASGEAGRDTALCGFEALRPPSPTRRNAGRSSRSSEYSGARRRTPGRRKHRDRDHFAHAVDLYGARQHTVKEICGPTGISRATLHTYAEEFSKQP